MSSTRTAGSSVLLVLWDTGGKGTRITNDTDIIIIAIMTET